MNDAGSPECSVVATGPSGQKTAWQVFAAASHVCAVLCLLVAFTAARQIGVFAFASGIVLMAVGGFLARRAGPRTYRGEVRLTEEGLCLPFAGHARLVTGPQVKDGYEVATHAVMLELKNGETLRVELPRALEPEVVLANLGVGAEQHLLSMPLRGTFGPVLRGMGVLFSGWLAGLMMAKFAALSVLVSMPIALLAWVPWYLFSAHQAIAVGRDGIRIQRGALRRRFIPYDAIARVDLQHATAEARRDVTRPGDDPVLAVQLVLHGGTTVLLPLIGQSSEKVMALEHRVRSGVAQSSCEGHLAALERGGRSLKEWRSDLHRIVSAADGYRAPGLRVVDVERVLVDTKATREQRIGAALALKELEGQSAGPRIRLASSALADRSLQEALEAAADEDQDVQDAAIERALDGRS
jgi:hypothetical protein